MKGPQQKLIVLCVALLVALAGVFAASKLSRPKTETSGAQSIDRTPKETKPSSRAPSEPLALQTGLQNNPSVTAGGGGTSSGGSIRIEGTIGETSASRAMSGGSMTLRGGFWNILGSADATLPSVAVSVSPFSTSKTGVDLVFTFTRFGSTGGALNVTFAVSGTATLGTHYSQTGATTFDSSTGTVTILQGNTTAAVNIHPIPSSNSEVDRTIILTVVARSGYTVDNPSVAIGTVIYDNTAVVNPPVVLTDANTNNASALDSVTFVGAPFRVVGEHNFSSDRVTRVILFTSYLGITQPSPSLAVRAGGFDLPVENVGPILLGSVHASYIVVRLPQNLPPGDLLLTVSLNNTSSSATILSVAP